MTSRSDVQAAIERFCAEVRAKTGPQRRQQPEAQLTAPLEHLVRELGRHHGLAVRMFNEERIPDLSIRPDFGVRVNGADVGYIEMKAPGKGVPSSWKTPSPHDRKQWSRLQLLPNVLYTDGEQWALYRRGEQRGRIAQLDLARRKARGDFEQVVLDFLSWEPISPRTIHQLVNLTADLCRLLRDEVVDILERRGSSNARVLMARRADDWRQLLFPNLGGKEFADAYAQTVTFALLLARQEGIDFTGGDVTQIARLLGKKHLLLGKALDVLTSDQEHVGVALDMLVRVLKPVDWSKFPADAYMDLYELFLARYDPALRKKSGSYYTPAPLVEAMTRLVNDILVHRMDRVAGLAGREVFVIDPAMGTGSFLEAVVQLVGRSIEEDRGAGALPTHLRSLASRLAGFEKQAAPYAVAELRLHAAFRARGVDIPEEDLRFLADTLDDPNQETLPMGSFYDAIGRQREGANKIKLQQPVLVVLGNPPYVKHERSSNLPAWITSGGEDRTGRPTLDAFRSPGRGRYEQRLHNLSTYFWRWATWKVFDAHPLDPAGVVALVTPSAYTNGPAYAGMREYLRRTADEGWIIDLSPEGFRPDPRTRLFEDTSQELCVAIFFRRGAVESDTPAVVRRTHVHGTREEKFDQLQNLHVSESWDLCESGWTAPFTVQPEGSWTRFVSLSDMFPWSGPGIRANRTWVWSAEGDALRRRWDSLITAVESDKSELFKESRDATLTKVPRPLPGFPPRTEPFIAERGESPDPVLLSFRAFDRQYLIPDARLLHAPSPAFWATRGPHQIFITEQHVEPVTAGPALLFSSDVPDLHHFNGRGGRVAPLFREGKGRTPNIAPGLLDHLSKTYGVPVKPEDLITYVAAVVAHGSYTKMFADELGRGGRVRVPVTSDPETWRKAVGLGRRVIWLHTFGQRCMQPRSGRKAPRLPAERRPRILTPIVGAAEDAPGEIGHEGIVLRVGRGTIAPVPSSVWEYEVSGWRVVRRWFSYRCTRPTSLRSSPLDEIRPIWTDSTEEELLDLLQVLALCVDLEPEQDALLQAVVDGPLLGVDHLVDAGVLPVPSWCRKPPQHRTEPGLWGND